jgi:hypothetical protein
MWEILILSCLSGISDDLSGKKMCNVCLIHICVCSLHLCLEI